MQTCKTSFRNLNTVFSKKTDTVIFNLKQSQRFLDEAQWIILLNKYLKCSLQSHWVFAANWWRWDGATGKVKSWNVSKILRGACNIEVCTNYSVKGLFFFVEWQHKRKWIFVLRVVELRCQTQVCLADSRLSLFLTLPYLEVKGQQMTPLSNDHQGTPNPQKASLWGSCFIKPNL